MLKSSPSNYLYRTIKSLKLDFCVSVPCSLLSNVIKKIEEDNEIIHTPVTREEEGLGILAGAYLCGKKPVIIMQNSGLGNCINAITSLVNLFELQIIFIVSHRGSDGEKIDAQKPMGNITKELFELAGIECKEILYKNELSLIKKTIVKNYNNGKSMAFLFPFSFWNEIE